MTKDAFKDRERALETEFFRKVDDDLLQKLKSKLGNEKEIEALCEATGFTEQKLLSELVELGLSPETVMAISLVPLVLVAWADGKVDSKERPAIFEAAKSQGITDGSPAAKMMKHWLNSAPEPKLGTTWRHYIQQVCSDVTAEACEAMREDFDRRTKAIAKASGGLLGFGKVSEVEKRVIADLRQAFDV